MNNEHEFKNAAEKRKLAPNDSEGYLATVESLEPDIHPIDASAFYASAAISLKRIADALEKLTAPSVGVAVDYPFTHKTYDPFPPGANPPSPPYPNDEEKLARWR